MHNKRIPAHVCDHTLQLQYKVISHIRSTATKPQSNGVNEYHKSIIWFGGEGAT